MKKAILVFVLLLSLIIIALPVSADPILVDDAPIEVTTDNNAFFPDVAASASQFVVVWNDTSGSEWTSYGDIFARVYGADGAPKTNAIPVTNDGCNVIMPSVDMAADGSFIVMYGLVERIS